MLNITSRISLSRKTKQYLRKYYKNHGGFSQDAWDRIDRRVKNEISKKLFFNQGYKCVYCEKYLTLSGPEIDHFAHKGAYPSFSFTTVNLFYSCNHCNTKIKGRKSTILNLNKHYNRCVFTIVHPYYDIPDNEIRFQDPDKILIDFHKCSPKGIETIRFFQYDDYPMTYARAYVLTLQRSNPMLSRDERILIQKSIAYR